jgi:hypothetical protein
VRQQAPINTVFALFSSYLKKIVKRHPRSRCSCDFDVDCRPQFFSFFFILFTQEAFLNISSE